MTPVRIAVFGAAPFGNVTFAVEFVGDPPTSDVAMAGAIIGAVNVNVRASECAATNAVVPGNAASIECIPSQAIGSMPGFPRV